MRVRIFMCILEKVSLWEGEKYFLFPPYQHLVSSKGSGCNFVFLCVSKNVKFKNVNKLFLLPHVD